MPEGDSIYVLARKLRPALVDRRVVRAELRVPALATLDLSGASVTGIVTHGKHQLTRLLSRENEALTLHTHLKMTGSWTVVGAGKRLPARLMDSVRVLLELDDGTTAYGLDLPVVEVLPTSRESDAIGHLGPDPLRDDWDAPEAVRRLRAQPERPVAAALLDQRNLAGLGNLWVNELCFLRGTSPWTPVGELDVSALVALAVRCLRHSALVPGAYQVTTGDTRDGRVALGLGPRGQGVPALRDRRPGRRRGARRRRATAYVVVPELSARPRARPEPQRSGGGRRRLGPAAHRWSDASSITERTFPAGSVNHAIVGPHPRWTPRGSSMPG